MGLSRREFLGRTLGFATLSRVVAADPLSLPIGTQVYPVRESLGKDFDGTLRELAATGYRTIEMCSPQGYGGASFGPLPA